MDSREALVALNLLEGVGPVRVRQLLEFFGDAAAVLQASKAQLLQVRGIGEDTAAAIANWENSVDLAGELRRIADYGCRIVIPTDPEYPPLLREIYDPPVVLYIKGTLTDRDRNAVAIVGSRQTTHYGLETARKLGYQLAYTGVTVVSGGARGIDTAAHQGALSGKGRTIAVLGTAHLWLYEDSVLVKDPGSPVPTRWHTDDGYFHAEGRQMATVWVALDPSPRASGSLRFLRGSHRDDRRYRPTLFVTDDPIPGTEGELVPDLDLDDPQVFGWDLEPGDLTIHHARTLHAAGGNLGATPRRALSVRYCGDDAVVRVKPGAPGKPGFDAVDAGTPIGAAAARLGLLEAALG